MKNNYNEEKWMELTLILKNCTENIKMIEKDIRTLEKVFHLNQTKSNIKN
ncbi:MAG TPA: hypothetical protein VNR61_18205 [Niallia sp.]|nr:hypothetical protein [Niallia sp.]